MKAAVCADCEGIPAVGSSNHKIPPTHEAKEKIHTEKITEAKDDPMGAAKENPTDHLRRLGSTGGGEKPPLRPPGLSPNDQRGPESVFHFPSKPDSWAQDVLRAMERPTHMTEYAAGLCEKSQARAGD